jgi:hypothetical protein
LKDGIKQIVNRFNEPSPRAPLPRVPRVKQRSQICENNYLLSGPLCTPSTRAFNYSIGMRGIHDSGMLGGGMLEQRAA